MRRVVVFMGGTRDSTLAVQRALLAGRDVLASNGILVPEAGRRRGLETLGLSHQPLVNDASPGWRRLQKEVAESPGRAVFLVIPGLLRIGAPERRRALVKQLSTVGEEICVVSVVADQLTLVNEFYLNQVTTWRLSKRFESAVPRLLENEMFAHERLLIPWHNEGSVQYSAVLPTEFNAGHPISVVLEAAGVELSTEHLETGADPPLKLGSIGVEANRLLSTYLRAEIPGFDPDDEKLVAASRRALSRAQIQGWCDDAFWGWTPRLAATAVTRFSASNERLARAVWGTDWPLPYPLDQQSTQVDFLDLDAQSVEQVQRYVTGVANRLAQDPAEIT